MTDNKSRGIKNEFRAGKAVLFLRSRRTPAFQNMRARAQIYAVKPKIKTANNATTTKQITTTRGMIHLPKVLQRIKSFSKLHCKALSLAAVKTATLGWHNGVEGYWGSSQFL